MAKKIIKYKLTPEGTTPSYVIDGGHFPVKNQQVPPQDFDLIGIAPEDATEESFASKSDLLSYVEANNFRLIDSATQQEVPISQVVNSIWSKL